MSFYLKKQMKKLFESQNMKNFILLIVFSKKKKNSLMFYTSFFTYNIAF